MNTSESTPNYDYFVEYVQNQLQAADLDIRNLKDEISQTLTANKSNNREKRGAPLVAFGALTALTAGAGIACAVGSIFGSCGEASRNCEDIGFALEKLQNNDQIWTEVKDNLEEKFFVVASQLKDIRLNEKQIIAPQENHARVEFSTTQSQLSSRTLAA